MIKKIAILIFGLGVFLRAAHAEIKILSTSAWSPTITGSWTNSEGLSYNNTVYGDTYYNAGWQDMSIQSSLQTKSVYRYFYLRPDSKRNWTFSMPISNLNAEKGYSYYATSSPNKKQSANQIYWAVSIGYKENGISRTSTIWIKRSDREYYHGGYEAYGSSEYISYNIDNNGWKQTYTNYPSCDPSRAPMLQIETYSWGKTYLKWGNWSFTNFPAYMEELTYIKVLVGTQAKIQIGKPSAYGVGVNTNNIYTASDLIEQENFATAKQKLYKSDGLYYEQPAFNLAWCYLMLGEYDDAINMCNALIKYNGETLNAAYTVRGIAKESKEQYLEALDDYQKAGEVASEFYSRLYNAIYHSNRRQQQPSQQQRQQTTRPINSEKPQLTK